MIKIRTLCFFILVFLVNFSEEVKKGAANFDPYAVLLFHPQMKDFNFILMRFEKKPSIEESIEDWNKNRNDTITEIRTLRNKLRRLKKSDVYVMHIKMQEMRKSYRDYNLFMKKWGSYKNFMESRYRDLEFQIEKDINKFFETKEDTEKKLSFVWRQILLSIKELQLKYMHYRLFQHYQAER